MILMLDSVTPSAFGRLGTTSSEALAGYDDGLYRNIAQIERDYPGHRHLAIAVHPWDDGDCLDVETGDARPQDAPGWLRRQHARGLARPWLYANASTWPAVQIHLQAAGIGRHEFVKWRADYDDVAVLLPDDDAKQYTDRWEGRNVDASVVRDDAFDYLRPRARPKRRPVLAVKRRLPRRVRRVHPKVVAATGGGGAGVGLAAVLAQVHVHLTPPEWAAIGTALAVLAGWARSSGR